MRPLFYSLLLLSCSLKAPSILACDCDDITVEVAVRKSKFIVVAQVIELLDTKQEKTAARGHARSYQSYRVKIKVKQSLKGGLTNNEVVEIGSDYSDCRLLYEKHRAYLLFLERKDTIYEEQGCSYSRLLKSSESLLINVKKAVKDSL